MRRWRRGGGGVEEVEANNNHSQRTLAFKRQKPKVDAARDHEKNKTELLETFWNKENKKMERKRSTVV